MSDAGPTCTDNKSEAESEAQTKKRRTGGPPLLTGPSATGPSGPQDSGAKRCFNWDNDALDHLEAFCDTPRDLLDLLADRLRDWTMSVSFAGIDAPGVACKVWAKALASRLPKRMIHPGMRTVWAIEKDEACQE